MFMFCCSSIYIIFVQCNISVVKHTVTTCSPASTAHSSNLQHTRVQTNIRKSHAYWIVLHGRFLQKDTITVAIKDINLVAVWYGFLPCHNQGITCECSPIARVGNYTCSTLQYINYKVHMIASQVWAIAHTSAHACSECCTCSYYQYLPSLPLHVFIYLFCSKPYFPPMQIYSLCSLSELLLPPLGTVTLYIVSLNYDYCHQQTHPIVVAICSDYFWQAHSVACPNYNFHGLACLLHIACLNHHCHCWE